MDLLRHWLATKPGNPGPFVIEAELVDGYRAQGFSVSGPFVLEAHQPEGVVEEHRAFVEALTDALNDHGVPAMPSWREAIDWLAANGVRR